MRDIYAVDDAAHADRHDRSPERVRRRAAGPDPGQGPRADEISNYWFARTRHIVPNHLATIIRSSRAVPDDAGDRALLADRSMVVRKLKALPVEAVVRGYLIGSGWKDYQRTGEVCGIALPAGLELADRLPTPIFTPSTKAERGQHDENVGFDEIEALIGADARGAGARRRGRAVRVRRGASRSGAASSSRTRSSSSASTMTGTADTDRRGADTGFIALLAGRHLPARAPARRRSTSSSCATTSRRSTGTSARPRRSCPPTSSGAPARSTRKRCGG